MDRRIAALLLLTLVACADESRQMPLAESSALRSSPPRYQFTKITSHLGGTAQRVNGINLLGWVVGWSTLSGDSARHAVLWRRNTPTDLGTLGGSSSQVQWNGINEFGHAAGISFTSANDPRDERWSCEEFMGESSNACRGFYYDGRMQPMPTLGGTHSFATGINNRSQVVGWAQTGVLDPTCGPSVQLQFRAVIWEPRRGRMTQLKPYPGDSTSAATAINERGQVVGISGACDQAVGRFSARHAVLWDHGRVIKLPTLGGISWNTPMAINEWGDVVGFSNEASEADQRGEFGAFGFVWSKRKGIKKLVLDGDNSSQALGINSWGQVVGFSSGGSAGSRAFLYQGGVLHDLNSLREAGVTDSILSATSINELGQISGRLKEVSTGKFYPYIATPVRSH